MNEFNNHVKAKDFHRDILYYPQKRPGFVAWVTTFDYGNGEIGISFKETLQTENKNYIPPRLEMGEAVGAPVSYCSVECGSPNYESYRVYLKSADNGKTWVETGRCLLEEGSFCNIGFPDGRIIGFDVPRINEDRSGWCNYIIVRESLDGGTTWKTITKLLDGCAPYLWRARRLKDGTVVILASLYGTPWGPGELRSTRNTMLPGETYLNKIQTFFMTTKDGYTFSGPHYILPGVGAHEYDFVECNNGDLLFIAGDVQATPVARQTVTPQGDHYINGTLFGIHRGAPTSPSENPQGGFVPETMVTLPDGTIIGSRRNKPYSCSIDMGENWFEVDGLPASLYQPVMTLLPNGTIANFGHYGGDDAFGQTDMYIGVDYFTLDNNLPKSCQLTLSRCMAKDNSHYINAFSAKLTRDGEEIEGQPLTFRFNPVWNADGTVSNTRQSESAIQITKLTDKNGNAIADVSEYFDSIRDIHYYYNVDVVFDPEDTSAYLPCEGPMMCSSAMTPYRKNRYPYPTYFAEGTLYLSPELLQQYPDLINLLTPLCKTESKTLPDGVLPQEIVDLFLQCHILQMTSGGLVWSPSIHASHPLNEVSRMAEGDWYI